MGPDEDEDWNLEDEVEAKSKKNANFDLNNSFGVSSAFPPEFRNVRSNFVSVSKSESKIGCSSLKL